MKLPHIHVLLAVLLSIYGVALFAGTVLVSRPVPPRAAMVAE